MKPLRKLKTKIKIAYYKSAGRIPWSRGYSEYKWNYISSVIHSHEIMDLFKKSSSLPSGYGQRLDERVVEYPWILSQIPQESCRLLDAGSILNHPHIISHPDLRNKKITITTLAPEHYCYYKFGISYLYEDLRNLPLRDNFYDMVICISTLEHVGMDNTRFVASPDYFEKKHEDFKLAIREMQRVLKHGGIMLVTVPYGQYESFGWFQVFDSNLVMQTIETFNPNAVFKIFYIYTSKGWNISDENTCSTQRYFDKKTWTPDFAAAARAVCCLKLTK